MPEAPMVALICLQMCDMQAAKKVAKVWEIIAIKAATGTAAFPRRKYSSALRTLFVTILRR